MKNLLFLFIIIAPFFFTNDAIATSGACSSHNGINCNANADTDGSIICNDGWRDSTVNFYTADECKNSFICTNESNLGSLKAKQGINRGLGYSSADDNLLQQCQNDIYRYQQYNNTLNNLDNYYTKYIPNNTNNDLYNQCIMFDYGYFGKLSNTSQFYYDNKCQYPSDNLLDLYIGNLIKNACNWQNLQNINFDKIRYFSLSLLIAGQNNNITISTINNLYNSMKNECPEKQCIIQSDGTFKKNGQSYIDNGCLIKREDLFYTSLKNNVYEVCGNNISTNNLDSLVIIAYYNQSDLTNEKIANILCPNTNSKPLNNTENVQNNKINSNSDSYINDEKKLVSNVDTNLTNRMKGKILLQVENHGEGWYINPSNGKRYYLGRPDDAFQIMRELGLGISENDYKNFNSYAPRSLSGKILLRVEANGEAYYVNPDNLKLYYLGRPTDAFNIMRNLGLGISNQDIQKIQIN